MFPPNVRNLEPCRLRHLITLFVSGAVGDDGSAATSVDASMYCSFNTNCRRAKLACGSVAITVRGSIWWEIRYQYTYNGIETRVVLVAEELFDNLKQVGNEAIINLE